MMTYEQTHENVIRFSNALVKKGIKKGDRVALTGKNSPEWALSYLAILYAGAVVVPLDYQLKPEEMDYLMGFAEVKILIVDEEKYDLLDTEGTLGLIGKYSLSPKHATTSMIILIRPIRNARCPKQMILQRSCSPRVPPAIPRA